MSMRRCGCRRCAPRPPGRSSATGSTSCRRGTPGPNLDELPRDGPLLRSLAAGRQRTQQEAPLDPPLTWFERDAHRPSRSRQPGRVAGAPPRRSPPVGRAAGVAPRPRIAAARRAAGGPAVGRPVQRTLPAPPDDGHPRLAVVGRRRLTQRPGPRPAPGRGLRTGLHLGAARRAAVDPRLPGGRAPPGRVGPDRDRGRASCRRRTRWDVGAGDGRHPEPHAPALACEPEPLEPGRVEEIRVQLRGMGYRFEPGHRIRVSVASSAWPVVWPSPFPPSSSCTAGPPRHPD